MKKNKINVLLMVLVMTSLSLISVHGYKLNPRKWPGTAPISVYYK